MEVYYCPHWEKKATIPRKLNKIKCSPQVHMGIWTQIKLVQVWTLATEKQLPSLCHRQESLKGIVYVKAF